MYRRFRPSHLVSFSQNCTSFLTILIAAPAIITTAPTFETNSPQPPPLTRKRSRILPFSRSKQDENPISDPEDARRPSSNEARSSMDKKRSFFAGVMASKDPATELRKMAGARLEAQMRSADSPSEGQSSVTVAQEYSSNIGELPVSSGGTSPGVESIQSLFDDKSKNRSFTFLPKKQRNRKSLFPLLADRQQKKSHTAPPTAVPSPRPSTSVIQPDSSASQATWPRGGLQSNFLSTNDHPGA